MSLIAQGMATPVLATVEVESDGKVRDGDARYSVVGILEKRSPGCETDDRNRQPQPLSQGHLVMNLYRCQEALGHWLSHWSSASPRFDVAWIRRHSRRPARPWLIWR